MHQKIVLLIFFCLFLSSSCQNTDPYEIQLTPISFFDTKEIIGEGIFEGWKNNLACQGCAIYDDIIYVARRTGQCDRYQLIGNNINYLSSFSFESGGKTNHCNCIQFDINVSDSSNPILYISSNYRESPCFVEQITETGSKLIQTIFVEVSDDFPENMYFNLLAGDDGYLWLCGFFNNTLKISKFRKPELNQKEVTLTRNDVLDSWERNDYNWEQEVFQGMKMYNGKLYVVYGGSYNKRGVWIWDTNNHILEYNIDMTERTEVEFEDIEIYKGKMYLFVLGNYIFRFNMSYLGAKLY